MKRLPTNWDLIDKVNKEFGIEMAPDDHPVYSEGPTIMFVHHRPEQSVQKNTNSSRKSSPKDSD